MTAWKQPITTDCLEMDMATRLIFMEIMIHARNEDMLFPKFIQHGNKQISYQLKRGQSLFFAKNFKKLGASRVTIQRSLKLLTSQNSAFNMTFNRQPFGYIVTISNYDELTKMTFNNAIKQQSNSNQTAIKQHANNKSDKNVKNVKSEKNKNIITSFFETENIEELIKSKIIPYENQTWFDDQAKATIESIKEKMIDYYVDGKGQKIEIKNIKTRFYKFLESCKRTDFYRYLQAGEIKTVTQYDNPDDIPLPKPKTYEIIELIQEGTGLNREYMHCIPKSKYPDPEELEKQIKAYKQTYDNHTIWLVK